MYESRKQPPLPRPAFIRRVAFHAALALLLVAGSLAIGMCGYVSTEHLPWLDAFLNASMLLGGMGPVDMPHTEAGKLFAGLYALYAGLVFLVAIALVFTPILHRILHKLHWDQ
jgi:hypothetical protein